MSSQIIKSMYPVGRINYKVLRHFIISHKLQASETIQLHTYDFDELVLDFREFYKTPMPPDIKILGIKIQEQNYGVPRRSVQVTSIIEDKSRSKQASKTGRYK